MLVSLVVGMGFWLFFCLSVFHKIIIFMSFLLPTVEMSVLWRGLWLCCDGLDPLCWHHAVHSRRDAPECLTSDPSLISDWARANLVISNASATLFLHLSTWHYLPEDYGTYALFCNDTQLFTCVVLSWVWLWLPWRLNLSIYCCPSSIRSCHLKTNCLNLSWVA